jgi:hypothetical protein
MGAIRTARGRRDGVRGVLANRQCLGVSHTEAGAVSGHGGWIDAQEIDEGNGHVDKKVGARVGGEAEGIGNFHQARSGYGKEAILTISLLSVLLSEGRLTGMSKLRSQPPISPASTPVHQFLPVTLPPP